MLGLTMLADLVMLGSSYAQYKLLERVAAREVVLDAEIQANDSRQLAVGGLHFLVFFVTAIIFMTWFHRAYANLEPLGNPSLTFTPGWAVGCWFVPILNLYRPLQIAQEIWGKSDPSGVIRTGESAEKSGLIVFCGGRGSCRT